MKRAAKMTHHASYEYNISTTMRAEIEFFCDKLKPESGIEWENPLCTSSLVRRSRQQYEAALLKEQVVSQ
jgi:hypothetical protein